MRNLVQPSESVQSLAYQPLISLITPVFNTPEAYLRAAIESVLAQDYPHWELCLADDASTASQIRPILEAYAAQDDRIKVTFRAENGHISQASNTALALATGEFVACLDHDDLLTPDALLEMVRFLNQHPDADMIYSDEDHLVDDDRFDQPYLKPDWCPDTFLSWMYTCHLGLYRRSLVEAIGGFRVGYEGSQDYDLVLRLSEQTDRIFHLPKILYHWRVHPESANFRSVDATATVKNYAYTAGAKALQDALERRGERGRVVPVPNAPGLYNIRYDLATDRLVSLVIAVEETATGLDRCLRSIFAQTTYPQYEVVVSAGEKHEALLAQWQIQMPDRLRIVSGETLASLSHRYNQAAQQARGDYLLFLSSETEVITPDWLEGMLEQAQRSSIGAVGAFLFAPDNSLQHSGIMLGKGLLAENSQVPYPTIRNVSAVSAACLMCRREVFTAIGGWEEQLTLAFQEVDFGLKLRAQGYRTVCLPYVQLYQHQPLSQPNLESVPTLMQYSAEIEHLIRKWPQLREHDPCWSPYLTQKSYLPTISVVVPWWDHTELLPLWDGNLQHLPNVEVIFVDNGSVPAQEQALRDFCDRYNIKLIRNAENRGFAAANNQGLEVATQEYLLYLNNDIQILNLPIAYLCALAGAGMVGPGPRNNELNRPYVEGWALLIRRETLLALGGWNEEYGPGYWDDVDLNHRAELAGVPIIPVPELSQWIRHKTNATGRDGRLNQLELHTRNRGKFVRRYFTTYPKILIDGVFFQLYKTGIARVWRSLLEVWAETEFAQHLVVLDRANSAPKIAGVRYRPIPPYNYQETEADRELLQGICDEEGADLFISTYYTTPLTTPSVFMAYDMIPELVGADCNDPMWREKHYGINHASAYICISHNTAQDLQKFFPDITPETVTVAQCGVSSLFSPAAPDAIESFKQKYGISRPYFLLVGAGGGYKNSMLFFRAFAQLPTRSGFDIVCTGSGSLLETDFRTYSAGSVVHLLQLSDEELRLAYAGAVALVYPSQYEGFGMPIVEAMASGCPVITCPNGSIPEVADDAALYVSDRDVALMADALCEVQKPTVRDQLIQAGRERAQQFSWQNMAAIVQQTLIETTLQPFNLRSINLIAFPDWSQDETLGAELAQLLSDLLQQPDRQHITLLLDTTGTEPEAADLLLSSVMMHVLMESELEATDIPEVTLLGTLGPLQWQALLPRLAFRVPLQAENPQAIEVAGASELLVLGE